MAVLGAVLLVVVFQRSEAPPHTLIAESSIGHPSGARSDRQAVGNASLANR